MKIVHVVFLKCAVNVLRRQCSCTQRILVVPFLCRRSSCTSAIPQSSRLGYALIGNCLSAYVFWKHSKSIQSKERYFTLAFMSTAQGGRPNIFSFMGQNGPGNQQWASSQVRVLQQIGWHRHIIQSERHDCAEAESLTHVRFPRDFTPI